MNLIQVDVLNIALSTHGKIFWRKPRLTAAYKLAILIDLTELPESDRLLGFLERSKPRYEKPRFQAVCINLRNGLTPAIQLNRSKPQFVWRS
jgi:hypothetical protein